MIGPDVLPPIICQACHADEMGCGVKLGLSGRRCCADCGHDDDRRDHDHVVHHDLDDAEDLLDDDAEDLLDHDVEDPVGDDVEDPVGDDVEDPVGDDVEDPVGDGVRR